MWNLGRVGVLFLALYLRVPIFGHIDALASRGCCLSRDFNLAACRKRFPSNKIRAGGIPPSPCSTTLGVVLQTGRAALRDNRITLSMRLQRWVVWGVDIPFLVGRVIPGHHTSAPYVSTKPTHASIAVISAFGAAPRLTWLKPLKWLATFSALLHHVATWYLNVSFGSRYTPSQRIFSADSMLQPLTLMQPELSWRRVWNWMTSDFCVSNETELFLAYSNRLSTYRCGKIRDSVVVRPIPRIPMSSAYPKRALALPLLIGSTI